MCDVKITTYLRKLLKEAAPAKSISKDALATVETIVLSCGTKTAREAAFIASGQLAGKDKMRTLKGSDVEAAVRICFGGEIGDALCAEIDRSCTKYNDSKGEKGGLAVRSGLVLPPARAKHLLRIYHEGRLSSDAAVAMATVMEYFGYEILKLSSRETEKKTINVDNVKDCIENDSELYDAVGKVEWKDAAVLVRSPKRIPQA